MKGFYKVTKKINGRLYDYWQRTQRIGGKVKTFNRYIGPSKQRIGTSAKIPIDPRNIVTGAEITATSFTPTTIADLEYQISTIRKEIANTAGKIHRGLPEPEWQQAQAFLTTKYAQIRDLERHLETTLTAYLDTTLKQQLKDLGVEIHEPSPTPPKTSGDAGET